MRFCLLATDTVVVDGETGLVDVVTSALVVVVDSDFSWALMVSIVIAGRLRKA
jgi:hypothetical protein